MSDLPFGASSEVTLVPGCLLGLELALVNDALTTQSIAGRRWYLSIWRLSDRTEIKTITADSTDDSSGHYAALWLTGSDTQTIYDAELGNELGIEWGELLEDGRDRWEYRSLILGSGPSAITGSPGVGLLGPVTRVVRKISSARLLYTARGAPGLSAAELLFSDGLIDAPTVDAMVAYLISLVVVSSHGTLDFSDPNNSDLTA